MKKWYTFCMLLLSCMLLSGCAPKLTELTEDTVYIEKKGQITGVIVEDFAKDYYDASELEDMTNGEIAAFNTEHGEDCVSLKEYAVEDKKVRVLIDYTNSECYSEFNDVEFFAGLYPGAEDYKFPENMIRAKDGETVPTADVQAEALEKGYRAAVLGEKISVITATKILYVSENVELVDKNTARISGESEDLAFIIYK